MNARKSNLKPLALAIALALPASMVVAASMDEVVKTRSDQNVDEQYGRDSIYGFSRDAKPMTPEQSANINKEYFGKAKGYAAAAWNKTTEFVENNKSTKQNDIEGYGRAGGTVAEDRVEILSSDKAINANATPTQPLEDGATVVAKRTGDSSTSLAKSPSSSSDNTAVVAPASGDNEDSMALHGQMDQSNTTIESK